LNTHTEEPVGAVPKKTSLQIHFTHSLSKQALSDINAKEA